MAREKLSKWDGYADVLMNRLKPRPIWSTQYAVGVWQARRYLELFNRWHSNGESYAEAQEVALRKERENIARLERGIRSLERKGLEKAAALENLRTRLKLARESVNLPDEEAKRGTKCVRHYRRRARYRVESDWLCKDCFDKSRIKKDIRAIEKAIERETKALESIESSVREAKAGLYSPCSDCPSAAMCGSLLLACNTFRRFVSAYRGNVIERDGSLPSYETMAAIYAEDQLE